MTDQPKLYLISPPVLDDAGLGRLESVLKSAQVECLRLDLASRDAPAIERDARAGQALAVGRGVPVVIADHPNLVPVLGLDGLHLTDARPPPPPPPLRRLRGDWGSAPILGAHCGASRHDGMTAGEHGADYVSFGPSGPTTLGATPQVDADLFAWWAETIEVPVVAEGALDRATIEALAPHVDFFAIGPEIWDAPDPAGALHDLTAPLR